MSNISDIQQTDQIQSWNDDSQDGVINNTHFISSYLEYLNPIASSYLVHVLHLVGKRSLMHQIHTICKKLMSFDTSPNYSGSEFEGC